MLINMSLSDVIIEPSELDWDYIDSLSDAINSNPNPIQLDEVGVINKNEIKILEDYGYKKIYTRRK